MGKKVCICICICICLEYSGTRHALYLAVWLFVIEPFCLIWWWCCRTGLAEAVRATEAFFKSNKEQTLTVAEIEQVGKVLVSPFQANGTLSL